MSNSNADSVVLPQVFKIDSSEPIVTIESIEWSVDIVVCSTEANKVNTPIINIQLKLSNNTTCCYCLSQEELHQWRYSFANAVRNLAHLINIKPRHRIGK